LPQATRERLTLLVSELVTNAIRHAGLRPGDPIDVQATRHAGRVRLAVHDGGVGFEAPAVDGRDPLAPGGKGLTIVAALSDCWGVDRSGDGCTVWCEVAADDGPAGATEAVQLAR
jgi:anti-sigma regulatory factor (Ser/Thr protein kinase)